jgi:hypothetical protein
MYRSNDLCLVGVSYIPFQNLCETQTAALFSFSPAFTSFTSLLIHVSRKSIPPWLSCLLLKSSNFRLIFKLECLFSWGHATINKLGFHLFRNTVPAFGRPRNALLGSSTHISSFFDTMHHGIFAAARNCKTRTSNPRQPRQRTIKCRQRVPGFNGGEWRR